MKMQAGFKGRQVRASRRRLDGETLHEAPGMFVHADPESEIVPASEIAAIKLQARQRGRQVRAGQRVPSPVPPAMMGLEMDVAATKLQARQRGRQARRMYAKPMETIHE